MCGHYRNVKTDRYCWQDNVCDPQLQYVREMGIDATVTVWTQFVMDREVDIGAKTLIHSHDCTGQGGEH